mmetsp:Transcript_65034/g.172184  ORF Transcript_65034/g.172184 Transcript_65034/m.172184 type:complete len:570 (-) Transcript_65034:137-1846(-)
MLTPDAFLSFTVWRMAEDVRDGAMSKWSDPPLISELGHVAAELRRLREEVSAVLAERDADTAARLEEQITSIAKADCGELQRPLGVLADAVRESVTLTSDSEASDAKPPNGDSGAGLVAGFLRGKVPRWCAQAPVDRRRRNSHSNSELEGVLPRRRSQPNVGSTAPSALSAATRKRASIAASEGHSVEWLDSRWLSANFVSRPSALCQECIDLGGVGPVVVKYCAALVNWLADPQTLKTPQGAFKTLLPSHLRETAGEIGQELTRLQDALDVCSTPRRHALGSSVPRSPEPDERPDAVREARRALFLLLQRLAAQADAMDFSAKVDEAPCAAAASETLYAIDSFVCRRLGLSLPDRDPATPERQSLSRRRDESSDKLPPSTASTRSSVREGDVTPQSVGAWCSDVYSLHTSSSRDKANLGDSSVRLCASAPRAPEHGHSLRRRGGRASTLAAPQAPARAATPRRLDARSPPQLAVTRAVPSKRSPSPPTQVVSQPSQEQVSTSAAEAASDTAAEALADVLAVPKPCADVLDGCAVCPAPPVLPASFDTSSIFAVLISCLRCQRRNPQHS